MSAQDSELQAVRNCLIEGNWDSAPKPYLPVLNELTFITVVMLLYEEQELLCPNLFAREFSTWPIRGTKVLSKQSKDLERKSGGPGWIVTQREDALSVTDVSWLRRTFHPASETNNATQTTVGRSSC